MTWREAKIGDICDVVSGATPKTTNSTYWDGDIAWATPRDLSALEKKHISDTQRKITQAGLDSCSARMLPPGSVLFSSRAPIGLVAINAVPLCTNQGFKSMVPRDGRLSPDYLYWWLLTHRGAVQQMGRGATFREVSKKIIEGLTIPLPPLAEQKRIAATLDAADDLRAKRREALHELGTLLQSTFVELFGDPMANPKGWPMAVIGDLLESASYGTSRKADPEDGTYAVIRMNNITYSGEWDFTDLKYVDLEERDLAKHLVHKGQVLFNRTNSKELVGKTAVYRRDEPMAYAGYLIRGVVCPDANAEYIGAYMNTPQMKQYLRAKCRSIVGMANINATEFKAIPVPIPPVDLQLRFATIVESIESQKELMRAHLAELDTLFASLQQRAFNGEL